MQFLIAAAGAALVLASFCAAFLLGWAFRGKISCGNAPVEPVGAAEAERLEREKAEKEALRLMERYNADMAYGLAKYETGGEGLEL